MWLFLGIYGFLTLSVVFAVYLLHLTTNSGDDIELAEIGPADSVSIENKTKPDPATAKPENKKEAKPSTPSEKPPKKKSEPEPKPEKPVESKPENDKKIDVEKQVAEQYPEPKIKPLIEIVDNWRNIPPKAIPKMVSIRVPVEFEIREGGNVVATGKLPIGATMMVSKLDNNILSLSTGTSMPVTAALKINETDLIERIQARYDAFVRKKMVVLEEQRDAERKRIRKAIANEEALAVYNNGNDPRFDPIKTSLRKGEAGATIELEAAVKWKWAGKETIDGTEYDTAYVVIESETAFGLNEKEIKCALLNGKVEHWFDARSGAKL